MATKRLNYDQAYQDKFSDMNQSAVQALTRIGGDPVPEEPDQEEPKAAAPELTPIQEKEALIKDQYKRETYWIDPKQAKLIKDYAYTERVSVRVALGMILDKAFDQILKEYAEAGKELQDYNERIK